MSWAFPTCLSILSQYIGRGALVTRPWGRDRRCTVLKVKSPHTEKHCLHLELFISRFNLPLSWGLVRDPQWIRRNVGWHQQRTHSQPPSPLHPSQEVPPLPHQVKRVKHLSPTTFHTIAISHNSEITNQLCCIQTSTSLAVVHTYKSYSSGAWSEKGSTSGSEINATVHAL